ncbi:hypothetical protein [Dinghuibacter silviterrae]|uniref:DUF3187 family protein n=1 Tax=Dinghuibacter silviterrae TaxID=1539049 RepID=A0A4R8DU46_9BACT|nr:hypothetical protein [Dinghuibacter silviterrae]TDX01870.1 hypothetical protein EDB95_2914 [Dinghuibacter silviterrae]
MKKIGFAFLLLMSSWCRAQQGDISDLQTPASPGFVLMDKAPSAVDKPTTTKAFQADLLNLFQGGAIQFTPFWLKNHPTLIDTDYVRTKAPLYQTLNISAATVRSDTGSSLYTGSLGFRTQVIRVYGVKAKASIKGAIVQIKTLLTGLAGDIAQYQMDLAAKADASTLAKDNDRISKDTAAIGNTYRTTFAPQISRPDLVLELAGAALANMPHTSTGKTSGASLDKYGIWLNLKYSPSWLPLDIVGVGRYTWLNGSAQNTKADSAFLDYGAGLFYAKGAVSLSGEYLRRHDYSLKTDYYRLAVALNYKISDNIVAVASFGKDFDNVQNLFTSFGINFGLSKNTVQVSNQ